MQPKAIGWKTELMLKTFLFFGLALGALAVQAADFAVGRVEVEFAEQGWQEVSLPDTKNSYGGEKAGALPVQTKLYVRGTPGSESQILLLLSVNSEGMGGGRGGYMTYSPQCRSNEEIHREGNEGFRRPFAHCLTVMPLYSTESVFKALAPQLMDMQSSGLLKVPRSVYTVWSRHAISTGSFVDVRVFAMSPIRADRALGSGNFPQGVPLAHVAWGRQLQEAVKGSVHSISGRLVLPPIVTTPPALGNTPVAG